MNDTPTTPPVSPVRAAELAPSMSLRQTIARCLRQSAGRMEQEFAQRKSPTPVEALRMWEDEADKLIATALPEGEAGEVERVVAVLRKMAQMSADAAHEDRDAGYETAPAEEHTTWHAAALLEAQYLALAQQKAHVNNLLARIFRDGGQRQAEFATTAEAVEAADKLCADYIAALAQRDAEAARLTDERDKAQSDAENAVWNLAGCSIYALGYNLDEGHNMEMARPALNEVRELALKHRAAETEMARIKVERDKLESERGGWTGQKCKTCGGCGEDNETCTCKACAGTGEEWLTWKARAEVAEAEVARLRAALERLWEYEYGNGTESWDEIVAMKEEALTPAASGAASADRKDERDAK